MTRTFLVGGNWKMNGSVKSIESLTGALNASDIVEGTEVVIGAPAVYIPLLAEKLRKDWGVAGENCHDEDSGAYTGEISAEMLKDVGAKWVILGHSERRNIFGESDEFVAKKTKKALSVGLKVILCCGELLEEREAGATQQVVERQLKAVIDILPNEKDWENIVIAYEPVWAIGTGKVATPEQAQEVHKDIRAFLSRLISAGAAENTRIIYGGSVNEKNCAEIGRKPDVDGFLVGGASLKPSFADICNAMK
ncbi:Triosephosphate isomerase [Zancudomyces culisetae]|uniref:Triosephosphate isomerase n=1 Tax=Zancudomyces culisetae TaxID=1213189 RepID=A0A1R1PJZ4_ZANCU|nr:Triosephosphate isomerase [Zancudomyces culisetae]|eukprot:OMH81243.1 Triosephosphate isomerase [Zancudomyces culisetae]